MRAVIILVITGSAVDQVYSECLSHTNGSSRGCRAVTLRATGPLCRPQEGGAGLGPDPERDQ